MSTRKSHSPAFTGNSIGADGTVRLDERVARCMDVLDALPAAIYATDSAGYIIYYNQAAAALAGRQPELGKDQWCVTWRLYRPDGTPLPHDACPMAIALREGRPVRGVEAIAEQPDGTRVPFLPYPTPLYDASGALIGAVNMLVDITERKASEDALRTSEERFRRLNEMLEARVAERTLALSEANERLRREAAEREQAEAALRQAQKMEAVGQLAAGMAHDFNNLLTAILGNLELLERGLNSERLRQRVQAAARAARRGAKLNEQMLAFARKQHLNAGVVDLNMIVDSMEDMLRRTLGGTVEVATVLAPDLWSALVDATQIELVILNLAINARDAMSQGGTVRIETRNVKASQLDRSVGVAPGDYVCLSAIDTGIGMTDETLARACEPFYTTKEAGKGTGLGLAQVYGLARQSNGGLRIRSALGQGTTVEVYLPRSMAASDEAISIALTDGASAAADAGRTGTVLVVDDQDDVREVAAGLLATLGYQVVQAPSGHAALDLLGPDSTVAVLVADYTMPGMNGLELARAARAKRTDLPVVIVTGYAEITGLDAQVADAVFLKKPFEREELVAAIKLAVQRIARERKLGQVVALPVSFR